MDRAAIGRNGFIQPAQREAGHAEVGISDGVIRVEIDGFANPLDCDVMASNLEGDDAEEMERLDVLWLRRKDLAVERLRVRQAACLMVLKRDLKRLGDRHSGVVGLVGLVGARHACHMER